MQLELMDLEKEAECYEKKMKEVRAQTTVPLMQLSGQLLRSEHTCGQIECKVA